MGSARRCLVLLTIAVTAFAVVVAGSAATASSSAPLVGVTIRSFASPVLLQRVTPRTLSPEGAKLRLAGLGGNEGIQWAARGALYAVEVHGVSRQLTPIRIVDGRRMKIVRSIPIDAHDLCALGFDGPTLVALTADPWCYNAPGVTTAFTILRIDVETGRVSRGSTVTGLVPLGYPVSIAFGDRQAYVVRGDGAIDEIDLRTGVLRTHRPRRVLAKSRAVYAHWLGGGQLGVGARVVDVGTWRSRQLTPDANQLTANGRTVIAYGADGASVFTRAGRLRFKLLPGENIRTAHVVARYLYADADADTEVVDLSTRRRIAVVPHASSWALLAR